MNKPRYTVIVTAPDYTKSEHFNKLHNAVEYALKSAKKIEPELDITDENLQDNIDAIVEEFKEIRYFGLTTSTAKIDIQRHEPTAAPAN